MRSLLEPTGYEVRTAAGVKEALAMAGQIMPDLIVTDIHMPGLDGYELARLVSETPELSSIPCILISSTAAGRLVRKRALSAGVKQIVLRPIDPQRLLEVIERYIVRRTDR
jgi:CheY-like chemotaxis protein